MEEIIALMLSAVGAHFEDIDFFTLYALIFAALQLHGKCIKMYAVIKRIILKYTRKDTGCPSVKKYSRNQANTCTKDNC